MRTLLPLAVLLSAMTLTGCAWYRRHFTSSHESMPPVVVTTTSSASTPAPVADQKFTVTPTEGLGGKVAMVNTDLRFAVLTFPVGQVPAIDQHLNVYRNGAKIGEMKVTGPQRNENTVADIVTGEAAKDDEVRDK